jgi:hypothetical protein
MNKGKQETMMALVNEWKSSGMSSRAYSQKIGLSKSKFDYWIRKEELTNETKKQFSQFIEVGSLSENKKSVNENNSAEPMRSSPQIELSFPSGLCLKIYG